MTDEEKLLKKISIIFQEAKETINDGKNFVIRVHIFTENYATVRELGNNSKISIEIKQTKEDMEDLDKIKVRDYTKVEELNVMEEKKLNLKPGKRRETRLHT